MKKCITEVIVIISCQENLDKWGKNLFLHSFSPAVWFNLSLIGGTIESSACYIRCIRALCSERTSDCSNELWVWNRSTFRERFQDSGLLQFQVCKVWCCWSDSSQEGQWKQRRNADSENPSRCLECCVLTVQYVCRFRASVPEHSTAH